MKRTATCLLLVLPVLVICLLGGCLSKKGRENPLEPANRGSVYVDPQPAHLNASFHIVGPHIDQEGQGYMGNDEMAAGTYTVTWRDVTGWITPATQTKTLQRGGSITFVGTYVEVVPSF